MYWRGRYVMTNTIYQTKELTLNQQKWLGHYQRLCERAKERGLDKKVLDYYTERHHITPKCMGGTNEIENLVLLTASEHYVAHQLLAKVFPMNNRLLFAVYSMTFDKYGHRMCNKLYEWVRTNFSKQLIGRNKFNDDVIARKGKKISNTLKGRTKETHSYLFLNSEKIKYWHTTMSTEKKDEMRRKNSQSKIGRTKDNHLGTRISAEKRKGRTKHNNPGIAKMAETKNILPLNMRIQLISKRQNDCLTFKQIHQWLLGEGYEIAYTTIPQLYRREIKN